MIKRSIHQEDITIVNLYETNIGAPKYIRNREWSYAQGNPIKQWVKRAAVVRRVRKKRQKRYKRNASRDVCLDVFWIKVSSRLLTSLIWEPLGIRGTINLVGSDLAISLQVFFRSQTKSLRVEVSQAWVDLSAQENLVTNRLSYCARLLLTRLK